MLVLVKENCPMPCVIEDYDKGPQREVFPLRTDPYCRMHIMNSHEMDMRAYVPEVHRKGLHILRIDGRHGSSIAHVADYIYSKWNKEALLRA